MNFVKVNDDTYVNLNNVFYVTLCPCDTGDYRWVFWSTDGQEDHYVYSKSFTTEEQAENWIATILGDYQTSVF